MQVIAYWEVWHVRWVLGSIAKWVMSRLCGLYASVTRPMADVYPAMYFEIHIYLEVHDPADDT